VDESLSNRAKDFDAMMNMKVMEEKTLGSILCKP
jgi:hypothetical protein